MSPPRGQPVRFYGAVEDGRRSPSTWRVWTGPHADDVYVTSRHLAGLVKTSLHQSGQWQTSTVRRSGGEPWDLGIGGRHLDRWKEPEALSPGITLAFMIVMPASQLVQWRDHTDDPCVRLMMEPDCALSVDVLILRPTETPIPLRAPNSVVFAKLDLGAGTEVVLLSRKLPWSAEDERILTDMKAQAALSDRTFNDPRPPTPSAPGVVHMTRMTMFGTGDNGPRFVVDAFDPRPLPGHE